MNKSKNLRVWSWILIVLAVLEAGLVIIGYVEGDFSFQAADAVSEFTSPAMQALLQVVFWVSIALIVVKVLMGVLGLVQAAGKIHGGLHIVLAWIATIWAVVVLVMAIISLVKGTGSVSTVCNDVIALLVPAGFLSAAKAFQREQWKTR